MGGVTGFLYRLLHPSVNLPERPKVEIRPTSAGSLYPTRFEEFIGQKDLMLLLRMEVEVARRSGRPLAHLLFYGPPGVGKSAAAYVLAAESSATLFEASGPEFSSQEEVFRILDSTVDLYQRTELPIVLLIDEIDGMERKASYALHSLMVVGYCTWRGARLYEHLPLSIVGTCNFLSAVPRALKSRFAEVLEIGYYEPHELALIAKQSAAKMGFSLTEEASAFVGESVGGEPRRVNNRILRVINNLRVPGQIVGLDTAREALRRSGLRPAGLSKAQFKALSFLESLPKHRASLNSIAAYLTMGLKDVSVEVEGYLLYKGYIAVTPGGRELTQSGTDYLARARQEMSLWT